MDLEELKDKYIELGVKVHVLVGILIAVGIVYYYYDKNIPGKQKTLTELNASITTKKAEIKESLSKKEKTVLLEKKTAKLEDEIKKVEKKVPLVDKIEVILREVTLVAEENNVEWSRFVPPQGSESDQPGQNGGDGGAASGAYLGGDPSSGYQSKTIRLSLEGKFEDVARFINDMHHLEKVYGFKKISLNPQFPATESTVNGEDNVAQRSYLARKGFRVTSELEMIVYQESFAANLDDTKPK